MRRPAELPADDRNPRLLRQPVGTRFAFFTRSAGAADAVAGVRVLARADGPLRALEPARSKLGAALAKGYSGSLPAVGERWLYLGAASGTTASFVADLVGPAGAVFAVEKSLRPFARLLEVAEQYPNLYPILADARRPLEYAHLVPPVAGIYADVAQSDQVAIVLANAAELLGRGGRILLALKTASMGRERTPEEHVEAARRALAEHVETDEPLSLEPFHRRHYLLAGGGSAPGPPARGRERTRLLWSPRRGPRRILPRGAPPSRGRRSAGEGPFRS